MNNARLIYLCQLLHAPNLHEAIMAEFSTTEKGKEFLEEGKYVGIIHTLPPTTDYRLFTLLSSFVVNRTVGVSLPVSRKKARELITSGSVRINSMKITDPNYTITNNSFLVSNLMLLQVGKKTSILVEINL